MAKVLLRQSPRTIELMSLNPEHPNRTLRHSRRRLDRPDHLGQPIGRYSMRPAALFTGLTGIVVVAGLLLAGASKAWRRHGAGKKPSKRRWRPKRRRATPEATTPEAPISDEACGNDRSLQGTGGDARSCCRRHRGTKTGRSSATGGAGRRRSGKIRGGKEHGTAAAGGRKCRHSFLRRAQASACRHRSDAGREDMRTGRPAMALRHDGEDGTAPAAAQPQRHLRSRRPRTGRER